MAKRLKVARSIRSWACANIILEYNLFDEWRAFCYQHPKLKSNYRSANLFLLHKKMLYRLVANPIKGLNMDNLIEVYYG